jgi:hypothetical protein
MVFFYFLTNIDDNNIIIMCVLCLKLKFLMNLHQSDQLSENKEQEM